MLYWAKDEKLGAPRQEGTRKTSEMVHGCSEDLPFNRKSPPAEPSSGTGSHVLRTAEGGVGVGEWKEEESTETQGQNTNYRQKFMTCSSERRGEKCSEDDGKFPAA